MGKRSLCVVMPLFNEEQAIRMTVTEWLVELRSHECIEFDLLLIDDGSQDASLSIIREMAESNRELIIMSRHNRGHGRSCQEGYCYAHGKGYDLVMQIDSDGQCDPRFFRSFLDRLDSGRFDSVYGLRYYRRDGLLRFAISRLLSVLAFVRTGVWVFDPNVPYRLFKSITLGPILSNGSPVSLFNVHLALYHRKHSRVKYVPIVFRDRWGGSPSVKVGGLWESGRRFWRETEALEF